MTSLISKIAAASTQVGALKTDKRNAQQGYDYISADKILERAGDALAAAGVVIVPSITQEFTEVVKTDKGGSRYDSVVHFGMIVTDGETQLEMPWCGRGSDYAVPDKAMYKAITSGHKYFLMKLLNVGVGNEDGEHENPPQQEAKTQQKPQNGAQSPRQVDSTPVQRNASPSPTGTAERDAAVPTNDELEVLGTWRNPDDARAWAVKEGACANEFEARNSFSKIVEANGGKLNTANVAAVYLSALRHWNQKIAAKKVAA